MENVALPGELAGLSSQAARSKAMPLLDAIGLSERVENCVPPKGSGEYYGGILHDPYPSNWV